MNSLRELEALRFPIGKFIEPTEITSVDIEKWIAEIASLPNEVQQISSSLSEQQLDTPYRPAGWTARQVIHHLVDSHMNSYTRFQLALTENHPTIRPYNETKWAALPDRKGLPIALSTQFLTALHKRWELLLHSMTADDFHRTFLHPEANQNYRLDVYTASCAWHGKHHLGHIALVTNR